MTQQMNTHGVDNPSDGLHDPACLLKGHFLCESITTLY